MFRPGYLNALDRMMMMMMMMMMINFINVSRPHSLGKSHTNLGTQLIDIKNM